MPDEKKRLFLFEALELRSEYDARIKTLRDCLPESQKNRDRFSFSTRDDMRFQPSLDFDVNRARKQVQALEHKKRKLNSAIQEANFNYRVQFQEDTINLNEALELRKGLNEALGELHTLVVNASVQRMIYKEGRDILEPNELSYPETSKELEETRQLFRELNRKIRQASFTVTVEFRDEN
ncbi:MAG: hypothetical protein PVH61_11675 [Candidatus Aminicenantes bacterium]